MFEVLKTVWVTADKKPTLDKEKGERVLFMAGAVIEDGTAEKLGLPALFEAHNKELSAKAAEVDTLALLLGEAAPASASKGKDKNAAQSSAETK